MQTTNNMQATSNERYIGRLSDGRSAAAIDVDVRLGRDGVEIAGNGATEPNTERAAERRIWPYPSLAAAEPLTPHAIDVLLTSSTEPGAALFVSGTGFARALPGLAPQLSARALRWRHARPWVAATAALVVLAGLSVALDISPSRAIASLLPDKARAALGREALTSMTAGRRLCTGERGRAALDRLTTRLATGAPGTKFKVIVVDWSLMNAFAVPGEQIVLTKGILSKADSPDEIAGVLAHEMGHGIELHPESGLVRAMGLTAGAELLLGGTTGTIANIGILLAQFSYTRAAEHEADVRALDLLKASHISTRGFAQFFDRVLGLERGSDSPKDLPGKKEAGRTALDLLRTHPPTEERRKLVTSQPAYPSTPSLSATDWQALKSICDQEAPPARAGEEI